MSDSLRCVLVKIHGVGNQRRTWAKAFDAMLDARLAGLPSPQRAAFATESVWWADLSRIPGLGPAGAALARPTSMTADVTFSLVQQTYAQYLLAGGAPSGVTPAGLGLPLPNPGKIVAKLKDVAVRAADCANDVANYVSNNGVRIQVQHRLAERLFQLQAAHPDARLILASHSQGTMVSYDVLRLNGAQLTGVKTWVTMGSPLGWYLNFLNWGREPLGIASKMRWLNFYDDQDKVGTTLAHLVPWNEPAPQDVDVDNTGQGLDPHDHWHNPAVVERYFQLVKEYVAGSE